MAGKPSRRSRVLLQGARSAPRRMDADATRALLANIVESSHDAIIGKDLRGRITAWNAAAQRLYGYPAREALGRHISMLAPPERSGEMSRIVERVKRGERIEVFETERITRDGARLRVLLTVSPIRARDGRVVGASVIARDLSERRRAEEALRHAEKLAAVGRLAATIAHEINNPLESVANLLYLIHSTPHLPPQVREYLDMAQKEVGRVVHITRQTLAFFREPAAPRPVSPAELAAEVGNLYARRLEARRINFESRFEFQGTVRALPGELRQVLANLVGNATEAVARGGRIIVHIYASRLWSRPRRRGVRIVICDNGPGIPPDLRRRIFEPFFTTKGEQGTGLGLWVTLGIVEKHGGFIRLRSSNRPGRSGTVISVFLPADTAAAQARPRPSPRRRKIA